jgi:hypothetical protein
MQEEIPVGINPQENNTGQNLVSVFNSVFY